MCIEKLVLCSDVYQEFRILKTPWWWHQNDVFLWISSIDDCPLIFPYLFSLKCLSVILIGASQVVLVVKNLPDNASARDGWDTGSIPGSGRSPGWKNGNPLQSSCLGNAMGRGAWWAAVHGVTKSQTGLKCCSTHAYY